MIAYVIALAFVSLTLTDAQFPLLRRHDSRTLLRQHADWQLAEPQWFDQILDHFNNSNTATFKQLYYINNTLASSRSSPVLLDIGGEGPLSAGSVGPGSGLSFYARQIGATMIALEHRFYGKSVPNNDVSTANLYYLTPQQALADLNRFVLLLRTSGVLALDAPVISVGGSYSGALSAWLKSQYNDQFLGALASSAPVYAQYNFSQYLVTVSESLGPQCTSIVRNSTVLLESLLASPAQRVYLGRLFNTCTPLVTDNDVGLFVQNTLGPLTALVQYNTNYRSVNITSACSMLANLSAQTNALVALATFNAYYNTLDGGSMPFASGAGCMTVNYTDYVNNTMQQNGADRSWLYQCCRSFAYWQTSDSLSDQPFSTKYNTLAFNQNQCYDVFGTAFDTERNVKDTNSYFGGRHLRTNSTIMSNGWIDPWHTLSIYDDQSGELLGANDTKLLIGPTSHCQDLGYPRDSDIPELKAARWKIVSEMKRWLGQPPLSSSTGSHSEPSSSSSSSVNATTNAPYPSSSSSGGGGSNDGTSSSTVIIIAIISAVVLVLVAVFGFVVYRRRRNSQSSSYRIEREEPVSGYSTLIG